MRLSELEPVFLKIVDDNLSQWEGGTRDEADGIMFLCPKCFLTNGGPRGTESILCWRPHVSKSHSPGPGRWEMQGTGFDDLTLVADSSSIQIIGGCAAHFFVRDGEIVFA